MNDDMLSAGFLIGACLTVILWALTPNTTSRGEVVNKGIEYCNVNGGVQKMRLDYGGGKVWCNNGASFGLGG